MKKRARTVLIPKSLKATKSVGKKIITEIRYFLSKIKNTLKKTGYIFDKTAAKSIRSLTKRQSRR